MESLSALVLTKNEENNIVDCVESVNFADEIIIIDDFSEDRTVEVVKCLENRKIKVFKKKLENDFAIQRNYGLSKAKSDWVLFLDADERVSEGLASEITTLKSLTLFNQYTGFYIKRTDFMWGKDLKYGEIGNIKLLRLAKKDSGKWYGKVHEKWIIKGKIGNLKNDLKHFPHQTISQFLIDINYYTTIRAKELYDKGIISNWKSIICYPLGKFFLNYFMNLGFLDGIRGFVFATMMTFHSFLVRSKLWLLYIKQTHVS